MTLSGGQVTTIDNEITNDPLALGYAGKTNAEIAAIMNEAGSASFESWLPSETPVLVPGTTILGTLVTVDGWDGSNTADGAGADVVLRWMRDSNMELAGRCHYFWDASATFDMANDDARILIDNLVSVEESPFVPNGKTLISEAAMDALKRLGEVLLSRSRELIGRSITEAEVAQALA